MKKNIDYSKLSKAERAEHKAKLEGIIAQAKASDPFYYYEPSDGRVSDEGMALLREFLKEEDIPQRFDCQKDVHMADAEILGVSGGNQSSKSCTGAIEDYIQATGEVPLSMRDWYPESKIPKHFPQKIRVVAVSDGQLKNTVLDQYKKWVPRGYLKDGSWEKSYSVGDNRLTLFKNGVASSTIEFKTNTQDVETFQGPPLDKVTYDEEPQSNIYEENLVRFSTSDKLRIQFDWTPTKGLTWATDMFDNCENADGQDIKHFELCPVLNPEANYDTLRSIWRKIQKTADYNVLKRRILGKAISLSGLVYGSLFSQVIHVVPPEMLYKAGKINYDDYIVYRGGDVHQVENAFFVELAVDSFGFKYVVGCCEIDGTTEKMKYILAQRAKERNYRLGKTIVDKSCDSIIKALGNVNIYENLKKGDNAIPALDTSDKYFGSISGGIDQIKKDLKLETVEGKEVPKLFVLDLPENKPIIQAFRTMEKDTYANEDRRGPKDKILEGKHHAHAALRYIYQMRLNWFGRVYDVPEPEPEKACV